MNTMPEKASKPTAPSALPSKPVQRKPNAKKNESFIAWLEKNKSDLQEEFPDLSNLDFSKAALARFQEESAEKIGDTEEIRKRKLSSPGAEDGRNKRSAPNKLAQFLFDK